MDWMVYPLSPIDFGWGYLPTVEEAAGKIASADAALLLEGAAVGELGAAAKFLQDLNNARKLAVEKGWEGDFRKGCEPRVLWLPAEVEFQYAFAWKQDNNGSTFVVSPMPLPWLDDMAY